MTDLAACYFCGAVLDEPVSSVTLGDGSAAPAITLCRGCREKLETVLEATDRGGGPDDLAGPEPADGAVTEPQRDADPRPDAPAAAESRESNDDVASSGESTPTGIPAESRRAEAAGDEAVEAADGADPPAGPTEANAESAAESEPGPGVDVAPDESPGDGSMDEAIAAGEQELSALEYNRVMRLLQNREFPVDREAFVSVAANAYEISRADCDRVIDVAIDRGLLDEAEGALVAGD